MSFSIPLSIIKSKSPCQSGYRTFLKALDYTPNNETQVKITQLLITNTIEDVLWVIFTCIPERMMDKRNMMADFAESVLHIFEEKYQYDRRPRAAIEICRAATATAQNIAEASKKADMAVRIISSDDYDAKAAVRATVWCADGVSRMLARPEIFTADIAAGISDMACDTFTWSMTRFLDYTMRTALLRDAWKEEEERQKQIILKYFG